MSPQDIEAAAPTTPTTPTTPATAAPSRSEPPPRAELPWTIMGGLAVPSVLVTGVLLYILLLHPEQRGPLYGSLALFAVTPAGKFAATAMVQVEGVTWFDVVLILGTWDLAFGVLFSWNMEWLRKMPVMGPRFVRWEAGAERMLERSPWIRRTAFLGLVALVAFPFQGTGAIIGSIVGRLLGFGPWRTIAGVAIGSFGGIAAIAGISTGLFADGTDLLWAAGAAVAAGLATGLVWRKLHNRDPTATKETET